MKKSQSSGKGNKSPKLEALTHALAAREAALTEAREQKAVLEKEVHHRVGNNLQVVLSFLNLQERGLDDPAALTAMAETHRRVTALGMINRTRYQGPDLSHVNLKSFLESLVAELNLGDSVAGQKIQVEMNIELLRIDRELLTPLALFALEALEKSRERLSAGGRIFILLQSVAGLATMVITGSDSLAAFKSRGELGLTLMQAYARQLQGETTFATTPQGGLTITLTFPVGI